MKRQRLTLFALVIASTLFAEERGTLIFEDHFERSESQEIKEEIGNGWESNSKGRAKGNKQVDLKDGAMVISRHETADHSVSVKHDAEFRNGTVELRFMLEGKRDSLGLNFADLKFKEVHAGHLCVAQISTKDIRLTDLKTGRMDKKHHGLSKEEKRAPDMKKFFASKERITPHKLEPGKWYGLKVTIQDETMTVFIDGTEASSFTSAGIAHPTKRTLRLAVPKSAVVDDIKIFSFTSLPESG